VAPTAQVVDNISKMVQVTSLAPGVTVNSPLGLQCPAAVAATHVALATTAATVLMGLAARRGNSCPKAYQK